MQDIFTNNQQNAVFGAGPGGGGAAGQPAGRCLAPLFWRAGAARPSREATGSAGSGIVGALEAKEAALKLDAKFKRRYEFWSVELISLRFDCSQISVFRPYKTGKKHMLNKQGDCELCYQYTTFFQIFWYWLFCSGFGTK